MNSRDYIGEARDVFFRRVEEVERYFDFLYTVVEKKPRIVYGADSKQNERFDRNLTKILLANGYLLLYNLVESTMTNAIDSIHQHIRAEKTGFDDLRKEIKRIVLKRLRSVNVDRAMEVLDPVSTSIVHCGYDREDLFSGNLDAERIIALTKEYGLRPRLNVRKTRKGERLAEIREKRNHLAHGKISFVDCGHETSVDRLVSIKGETVAYLECMMNAVGEYIEAKHYLAATVEIQKARRRARMQEEDMKMPPIHNGAA